MNTPSRQAGIMFKEDNLYQNDYYTMLHNTLLNNLCGTGQHRSSAATSLQKKIFNSPTCEISACIHTSQKRYCDATSQLGQRAHLLPMSTCTCSHQDHKLKPSGRSLLFYQPCVERLVNRINTHGRLVLRTGWTKRQRRQSHRREPQTLAGGGT